VGIPFEMAPCLVQAGISQQLVLSKIWVFANVRWLRLRHLSDKSEEDILTALTAAREGLPGRQQGIVHGAVPSVGHLIYAGHADSFTRKAEHKEGACQPMAIKLPAW